MPLSTYDELKTSIADWLNRDDRTSAIPDFISLAEEAHRMDLDSITVETVDDITTPTTQYVDFSELSSYPTEITLAWANLSKRRNLEFYTLSSLNDKYADTTAGTPEGYAVFADKIWFGPYRDGISVSVAYEGEVSPLSDSVSTNAILDKYPSLYLYGSLIQAEAYLHGDDRIQKWRSGYGDAVERANRTSDRIKYGDPTKRARAVGVTIV